MPKGGLGALLAFAALPVGCSQQILKTDGKPCVKEGIAYAGGGSGNDLNVSWFCSNGDRLYVTVTNYGGPTVQVVPGGCPECR